MSNRQDAKVAKSNKFDVFACGETTSGKLGVLGVLAVKNAAYAVLQEKTMARAPTFNLEPTASLKPFLFGTHESRKTPANTAVFGFCFPEFQIEH